MGDAHDSQEARFELTERERLLVREAAVVANGAQKWHKRYGPYLATIVTLGSIALGVIWFLDGRYVTATEASEQIKEKADVVTVNGAITRYDETLKQLTEALTEEVRLRSLQGKDVEANARDMQRLERRLGRVEDRLP